ncbi:MAG TPA: hypothetical protein VGN61_13265 [Verrucomicrobiae bacterium]|jgi:uncharacterized membrane protein YkoI
MKTFFYLALSAGIATVAFSQTLNVTNLPEAVQKTMQTEAAGGTIADVQTKEEDGETRYSATISKGDEDRDITVAEDGTLRSKEIPIEQAPPVVRDTINKTVGNATLDSIEKDIDDGKANYDVDMTTQSGVTRDFTVEEDGHISSQQIALEDVPLAARDSIDAEVNRISVKIGCIYRVKDEDGTSYDIEIQRRGKNAEFSVSQDGKLESVEVFPEELPAVGQRTLRQRIAGGKLSRIDKEFDEDNKFMYHVEARKNGKPFDFMIGPGGRFRGME